MVAAGVIFSGVVAASLLQSQYANLIVLLALMVGGGIAWRSKRGDFYKELAEERGAENLQLREERDRYKELTDISPIVAELKAVTKALEKHSTVVDSVFEKVRDMNGSLRAHATAMEALADRLIVDEAARALLHEASTDKPRDQRQRRRTS